MESFLAFFWKPCLPQISCLATFVPWKRFQDFGDATIFGRSSDLNRRRTALVIQNSANIKKITKMQNVTNRFLQISIITEFI